MDKQKSQTVVISNTENEPFLLPIDISQYGEFEPDELEIRICNDFIEVSGQQEWRIQTGGADKRSFSRRHVLPKHIDLKGIYCRLLDTKTVLVSAPSLSFVSKLTNTNQLKVDYTLGLDSKGLQFLKRYNTASASNQTITTKSNSGKNKAKSKSNATNDVTSMLFDLVKNPSRGNKESNSKLFNTEQGQQNVNFINNLKSNGLRVVNDNKIRLDINQLMKDSKKDQENVQTKKSKKRRNKKKKSAEQAVSSTVSVAEQKKDEQTTTESSNKPSKSSDNKKNEKENLKSTQAKKKKEASNSKKDDVKKRSLKDLDQTAKKDETSKVVRKKENSLSSASKKKDDTKNNDDKKKDDLKEMKDEFKDAMNQWVDLQSVVDKSSPPSSGNNLVKSQSSSESNKFLNYISSFLSGGNKSPDTEQAPTNLTSCMKDKSDKNETKKEKHVVIDDSVHPY